MQGIKDFIPTATKAEYINMLLNCNFDTLDFGSFVSHKTIPQMRDTADVLSKLDLTSSNTKLLAIVANGRGAKDACAFDEISYLGYPFSISEEFQKRNTNATIAASLKRVERIQELAQKNNKRLVIYISMAFGNPYGEKWNHDIAIHWSKKLAQMGIKIIALSDTIGVSNPENIEYMFSHVIPELPEVEFGAHLHTLPDTWEEKVKAAYDSGCRRFDGAIKGFGGCPMAKDELTGNMPTEKMMGWLEENNISTEINEKPFLEAIEKASEIMA